jgi:hypothetical protein
LERLQGRAQSLRKNEVAQGAQRSGLHEGVGVRRALDQKRSASGLLLVGENLASRSPDLRVEIFESANQALDDPGTIMLVKGANRSDPHLRVRIAQTSEQEGNSASLNGLGQLHHGHAPNAGIRAFAARRHIVEVILERIEQSHCW